MIRATALAVAAAVATLAFAATAQASSIVFIRAGDVWLTTPDGSRELRVTSGRLFHNVSQADDGTIFAEGNGVLRRFAPDGRELAPPAGTAPLFDLDVSPDGSKIAFWYLASDGGRASVINSDGSPAGWDDNNGEYMQWASNDLAIYSNGAGWIDTFIGPGSPCCNGWFATNPDGRKYAPGITRAGDKLAVVFRDWDPDPDSFGEVGPYKIAWYANSAPPPRDGVFGEEPDQRPTHRCTVVSGDAQPEHPSFSPDGSAIAWEYPDGVRVQPALDLGSCTQPGGGFTIAGATSPDWGPAGVPITSGGGGGDDAGGGSTAPAKASFAGNKKGKVNSKGVFKYSFRATSGLNGTATFTSVKKVNASASKRKKVMLAKKSFTVPASSKVTLKVKLTKKNLKILRQNRKIKLKVTVKLRNAAGLTSTAARPFTLRR